LESLTASAATRPARRIFRARSLPALLGHAEDLLDGSPEIHPVDILAEKLPAWAALRLRRSFERSGRRPGLKPPADFGAQEVKGCTARRKARQRPG
jgi:hypothetical protein